MVVLIKIGHVVYQKLYFLGLGGGTRQVHYLSNMKLYPLLFEQAQQKLKKFTSFAPPDFALHVNQEHQLLTLIHVPSLRNMLKIQNVKVDSMLVTCAGMISLEESGNACLGAMQVGLVAGSPSWPGAGITMYALASDYYGTPLTSDRNHSSSTAARETWAKIEKSAEWKKAGDGLDNYAVSNNQKVYMDIQGTYPQRTVKPRMGKVEKSDIPNVQVKDYGKPSSRTPQEIDDCPLPTKAGDIKDTAKMSELLGTADAYKYIGTLKAKPLVDNFETVRSLASSKEENPMETNIDKLMTTLATKLFQHRYKGSETTR